mmetsp:Transcript_27133/g.55285  ORF Transcript_27133/g.55285 Transcript_27133/m.55285 type:complete len:205 (-) Transcript_27133:89-703(-)
MGAASVMRNLELFLGEPSGVTVGEQDPLDSVLASLIIEAEGEAVEGKLPTSSKSSLLQSDFFAPSSCAETILCKSLKLQNFRDRVRELFRFESIGLLPASDSLDRRLFKMPSHTALCCCTTVSLLASFFATSAAVNAAASCSASSSPRNSTRHSSFAQETRGVRTYASSSLLIPPLGPRFHRCNKLLGAIVTNCNVAIKPVHTR